MSTSDSAGSAPSVQASTAALASASTAALASASAACTGIKTQSTNQSKRKIYIGINAKKIEVREEVKVRF